LAVNSHKGYSIIWFAKLRTIPCSFQRL